LYDVNGLWHNGKRDKLKIVLINNGGGNIFKIIEGPSQTEALDSLFEARHTYDALHIASHFNLPYLVAHNEQELKSALNALFTAHDCAILEVFTRDVANEEVLMNMFKRLKQLNS
jgi:2-succinyl-5-enolpyruvyl-6-hydroxy-3-cyclohexene-1-carboxylate synthase